MLSSLSCVMLYYYPLNGKIGFVLTVPCQLSHAKPVVLSLYRLIRPFINIFAIAKVSRE